MKARVEYKIILLVYKALKYNEPKYLRNYLSFFRPETNVTVRHASELYRLFEPRTSCKLGERAFVHCAPRLFNKLPPDMKNIQEERKFKKELKTLMFSRSYNIEDKTMNEQYKL